MRFLLSFVLLKVAVASSIIATFADTQCKDSYRDITGPNGYPNGSCSALNSNGGFGSFQVVQLDPGCTATIYHNVSSGDECSGDPTAQIVATIAACYNTSWFWYSFDDCYTPGSSPTNAATSNSGTSNPKLVGPIVGGVVGGVVVLVVLVVALFIFMRRKKAQAANNVQVADSNPRHEMAANEMRGELSANPHMEMYSELTGPRPPSPKKAPVELPAEYYSDVPPKQLAQPEVAVRDISES